MNQSFGTYTRVMLHIWMSHVAHTNESCHTNERVMSHKWVSHVARMNKSYCTNERLACINESCHPHDRVMLHIWMSDVTHAVCLYRVCRRCTYTNESCDAGERVMSHTHKWIAFAYASTARVERCVRVIKCAVYEFRSLYPHTIGCLCLDSESKKEQKKKMKSSLNMHIHSVVISSFFCRFLSLSNSLSFEVRAWGREKESGGALTLSLLHNFSKKISLSLSLSLSLSHIFTHAHAHTHTHTSGGHKVPISRKIANQTFRGRQTQLRATAQREWEAQHNVRDSHSATWVRGTPQTWVTDTAQHTWEAQRNVRDSAGKDKHIKRALRGVNPSWVDWMCWLGLHQVRGVNQVNTSSQHMTWCQHIQSTHQMDTSNKRVKWTHQINTSNEHVK